MFQPSIFRRYVSFQGGHVSSHNCKSNYPTGNNHNPAVPLKRILFFLQFRSPFSPFSGGLPRRQRHHFISQPVVQIYIAPQRICGDAMQWHQHLSKHVRCQWIDGYIGYNPRKISIEPENDGLVWKILQWNRLMDSRFFLCLILNS